MAGRLNMRASAKFSGRVVGHFGVSYVFGQGRPPLGRDNHAKFQARIFQFTGTPGDNGMESTRPASINVNARVRILTRHAQLGGAPSC
jgi:hypothetical protein